MDITQTNLRYLLAVYELMGSHTGVAAVEVSRRMGVSKPSVTRMLGVLAQRGLLAKEPYGKVRLTERVLCWHRNTPHAWTWSSTVCPCWNFLSQILRQRSWPVCWPPHCLPMCAACCAQGRKSIVPQRQLCRWGTYSIAASSPLLGAGADPAPSHGSVGSPSHRPHPRSRWGPPAPSPPAGGRAERGRRRRSPW